MVTKEQIISQIEVLDDEDLLNDIAHIIQFHSGIEEDVYQFTQEELILIRQAEIDIENGQVYSHNEAIEMSKTWVKK